MDWTAILNPQVMKEFEVMAKSFPFGEAFTMLPRLQEVSSHVFYVLLVKIIKIRFLANIETSGVSVYVFVVVLIHSFIDTCALCSFLPIPQLHNVASRRRTDVWCMCSRTRCFGSTCLIGDNGNLNISSLGLF